MVRLAPWLEAWSITALDRNNCWLQSMRLVEFVPGDYLVHCGDRSDTLFLLDSGLVRLFYITPDGRERNKSFLAARQITGPVSAALTATPSPFSIECLEPIRAISFQLQDLLKATESNPAIARLYQGFLAEAFIRNQQREAMLLTCNAEQRYQWLLDNEPELPGRVPQFHIASYLGIDAVSLSRLKRKHSE